MSAYYVRSVPLAERLMKKIKMRMKDTKEHDKRVLEKGRYKKCAECMVEIYTEIRWIWISL